MRVVALGGGFLVAAQGVVLMAVAGCDVVAGHLVPAGLGTDCEKIKTHTFPLQVVYGEHGRAISYRVCASAPRRYRPDAHQCACAVVPVEHPCNAPDAGTYPPFLRAE